MTVFVIKLLAYMQKSRHNVWYNGVDVHGVCQCMRTGGLGIEPLWSSGGPDSLPRQVRK